MKRVLEIEKFRNLGLRERENFVLNTSLEKGKMGNLIIVVGANNSGKSNVLDALLKYGTGNWEERDLTNLEYGDEYRKPSLCLATFDGENIYGSKFNYGESSRYIILPKAASLSREEKEALAVNACKEYQEIMTHNGYSANSSIAALLEKWDSEKNTQVIDQMINALARMLREHEANATNGYSSHRTLCEKFLKGNYIPQFKALLALSSDFEDQLKELYRARFGIQFYPTIVRYQEKNISNNDLSLRYSSLQNSSDTFFHALLKALGMDPSVIVNAYTVFSQRNNKGALIDVERKINEKLEAVSKRFNELYFMEKNSYSFIVSLESERLFFSLFRDGKSIDLGFQSTGFKWFFNLYFNLLSNTNLKAGDIIVMDEPATNLHVMGQVELRKMLKEFAIKNDITIVVATHSPFLIDLDYLDELRVISLDGNEAHINNDFSSIDLEEPDSLQPIKQALTVSNHILLDPDIKVVFVEGITDYNYMTAFKHKFGIKDVVFLPIKGVGKYGTDNFKKRQTEISKRLITIRKHGPILMVDGDGAGKSMKSTNKDSSLEVFTLSDVNQTFKTIESLFSPADLKTFGFVAEDGEYIKHADTSALFKTFHLYDNVSQQTRDNFKAVFDYIETL